MHYGLNECIQGAGGGEGIVGESYRLRLNNVHC